jgi:phospholipase/carboxylesterase
MVGRLGRRTGRGAKGTTAVVLLHGFGRNGWPIWGVGDALRAGFPGRYVMPEGSVAARLPLARLWWAWPPSAIPTQHFTVEPAALERARGIVEAVVARVRREGAEAVVLAGVSQGGSLALDVAMRTDVDALVLFSSPRLVATELSRASDLPVFLAHGRSDRLVSFASAERLRTDLTAAGARVTFQPMDQGHELVGATDAAVAFLQTLRLPSARAGE